MTAPKPLRVGTRGSALAMAQTRLVVDALEATGAAVETVTIQTEGDRHAPDTAWGEGAFVTAIDQALLDGRVDVAVHSAKDVPTRGDPRLLTAAYLRRADARDALVGREPGVTLQGLPQGARVGTDSPRRTGFLLAARPDLHVHPLNGNVDTRLARLDAGETDALCLAVAGLERLGRTDRIGEYLDAAAVPPAPGQGAIAIQVRTTDGGTRHAVSVLDDPATRIEVETERTFLRLSGGGCRAPIGALARLHQGTLTLLGGYVRPDGTASVTATVEGHADKGEAMARQLRALLGERSPDVAADVAADAAAGVRTSPDSEPAALAAGATVARPRVLVCRAAGQAGGLVDALHAAGIDVVSVPAIAIEHMAPDSDLDHAVRALDRYAWIVLTSANAVDALVAASARVGAGTRPTPATRFAAVGRATADALRAAGWAVDHQPARSDAEALAASIPIAAGDRVLVPRADIADDRLPDALRARGAEVDAVVAYRTVEAPAGSRPLLAAALEGAPIDAVVLTSGSTARGLLALAGTEHAQLVRGLAAICIGPRTVDEARALGFRVVAASPMQAVGPLATLISETVRSVP
jgi:hydroxymethylbilane synthase